MREWPNWKGSVKKLAVFKRGVIVTLISLEIILILNSSKHVKMETLRKLKKRFIQKKSRTSSQKKATGEGSESEIKTPERPTLVDKCRSSESDVFAKKQQEQQKQSPDGATFRNRGQTMSCDSYFARDAATRPYMKDRVLTENAKDLSPEQWLALEMDIFKPLDFYEILFDRMKAKDKAEADRVRSS